LVMWNVTVSLRKAIYKQLLKLKNAYTLLSYIWHCM
jgi:hypothetical protein